MCVCNMFILVAFFTLTLCIIHFFFGYFFSVIPIESIHSHKVLLQHFIIVFIIIIKILEYSLAQFAVLNC